MEGNSFVWSFALSTVCPLSFLWNLILAPNSPCPVHQLLIDCVFTHTHPLFRPSFLPAFIPAPQFPPTPVSCSLTSHQCVITVSCVISVSHRLPSRLFPVDWPAIRRCITVCCVVNVSHSRSSLSLSFLLTTITPHSPFDPRVLFDNLSSIPSLHPHTL